MEQYKPIKEFPLYEISNYGNVRNAKTKKNRKLQLTQNGYLRVNLLNGNKRKMCFVHRLVWLNFIGEIKEGYQINHKDENKTNNHLENLELMTPKENSNYGNRNKNISNTKTNTNCKTVYQYNLNDELINVFPSTKEVQRQLGFLATHIADCCRKKVIDKRKPKGFVNINTAYGFKWSYNPLA